VIRPARPDDVDGIAAVHSRAWQAAYRGILPGSTLHRTEPPHRKHFGQAHRSDKSGWDSKQRHAAKLY